MGNTGVYSNITVQIKTCGSGNVQQSSVTSAKPGRISWLGIKLTSKGSSADARFVEGERGDVPHIQRVLNCGLVQTGCIRRQRGGDNGLSVCVLV